jgi:hypothetical protein
MLLAACTTAAMAAPPQDLAAPGVSEAGLATTVVRDHVQEGEFVPARPLPGDPANPFARTVLRTGVAEDDTQPARPLPVE